MQWGRQSYHTHLSHVCMQSEIPAWDIQFPKPKSPRTCWFLATSLTSLFVRGLSQCLFLNLIYISNKESHKATAYQCHCRGCDHHHNDTPSHVDQEAQTNSNQDLSQLHHGGEGSTVHTFASSTVVRGPHCFCKRNTGTDVDLQGSVTGGSRVSSLFLGRVQW